ncbi:hypothetical protein [Streptomyces chartreusis]
MNGSALQSDGSVVADFMTGCDRQLRPPLDVWAMDLRRKLQSLGGEGWDPDRVRSASTCMNLAALVVAHAGHLGAAERLCHAQLVWLAQLAAESGEASVLGNAVQPWVNLGRLRALGGSIEESLPHFRLAECLRDQQPVHLGPCHIPAEMWQPLVEAEPDLPDVLWNVFVLDQLKACLRSGDPACALTAAAALRDAAPTQTHRFITEGEVIALLRSGRAEGAFLKAAQAEPTTTSDEVAFLLHRIAASTVLGRRDEARRLAVGLTAFVTQLDVLPAEPATFLRQAKQLALLLQQIAEPRYAWAVHLHGMRTCRVQMDEPLHLEFLDGALQLAPDHPSAGRWKSERDRLLASSLYAEVRRRRGASDGLTHPSVRDLIVTVETAALSAGPYSPGNGSMCTR